MIMCIVDCELSEDIRTPSEDQKEVYVSRKLVKKRKHLHRIKKSLHNSKIKSH